MNTGWREIVQRPGQGSKDLNSSAGLNALSSRQGIISFCPKGNLAVSIPFSHITILFLFVFLTFFVDHLIPTPHQCTGFNCFALLLSHKYSLAWIIISFTLNESKTSSSHPKSSSHVLQTWEPRGSGRLQRMKAAQIHVSADHTVG